MNKKQRGKEEYNSKRVFFIPVRYLILLGLMFTLSFIDKIFIPITIYPVIWLLRLFFDNVVLTSSSGILMIVVNNTFIQIVSACIAGSAYLLLLILNLTVEMKFVKRIYSILLSFAVLLVLNIFRIFVLTILFNERNMFFDITHKILWYGLSTVFVILIWLMIVKIFSIKEIPVYSDIKYLIKNIEHKNNYPFLKHQKFK